MWRIRTADFTSCHNIVYSTTELPFTREGFEPSQAQIFHLTLMLSLLEYLRNTVQHAAGTAGQEVTSNTRALSNIPRPADAVPAHRFSNSYTNHLLKAVLFSGQQTAGYLTLAAFARTMFVDFMLMQARRKVKNHCPGSLPAG